MIKKIKRIKDWLRNGNDCEHCPCGWEEHGYDDVDAGCHIRDDCWDDGCRLPMWLRKLRLRRWKYYDAHQYDGIAEWYENQQKAEEIIRDVLKDTLSGRVVCWKGDGELVEVDTESVLFELAWRGREAYDAFMYKPRKSIPTRWAELIKETVSVPVEYIKSYLIGG